MRILYAICLCFWSILSFSQVDTLREKDFLDVINNHPLAKKAKLKLDKGDAELLKSKGGFDPYLYSYHSGKTFAGDDDKAKTYYRLRNTGLKVPTWYGLELKAGFEDNGGRYVNAENTMPREGLTYLGLSATLLRGLVIDQRRAALKMAREYQFITEQQSFLALNDLVLESVKAYWDWALAHKQVMLYEDARKRAVERFQAVKVRFRIGDMAGIDTLEADIQLQNREILVQKARLEEIKTRLIASNYLWDDEGKPLEIKESTIPQDFTHPDDFEIQHLKDSAETLLQNHPALLEIQGVINQLEIGRKLKAENLKPQLDVNYNFLQQDIAVPAFQFTDNYKFGINFSFPIFLRKARGDLQKAQLAIQEKEYSRDSKQRQLRNKIDSYLQAYQNYHDQEDLVFDYRNNYRLLFKAEQLKFRIGDSSLLKLNLREIKLLDAELKYAELHQALITNYYTLRWVCGVALQ